MAGMERREQSINDHTDHLHFQCGAFPFSSMISVS